MAKPMTSDQLIKSLKRRAMIPSDQSTFDTEDFLEILNEEISTGILPYLLEQKEEHLVNYVEVDISGNSSPLSFDIPYRSVGNKLRDVSYIDSSGNAYELSRISLEEISDYSSNSSTIQGGVFYLENNSVVIPNMTSQSGSKIRMYFYLRPSSLVQVKDAGKILSIAKGATETVITLDNFPSKFSNDVKFDIVGSASPNKLKKFDVDKITTNSNTKSVTIANEDVPSDIVVGDFICEAQESPFPQMPTELHTILAQRGAVYCLESLGDTEGLSNATRRLNDMEKAVTNLIENRVEGAPQKIKTRHSPLRDAVSGAYNKRRGN